MRFAPKTFRIAQIGVGSMWEAKEVFVALIQMAKWKNSETHKNSCGIWVRLICLLPPIHYLEPHGHLFMQKNLRFNFGSYHKILFDWFFCREEGWTLMNLHILHQKKGISRIAPGFWEKSSRLFGLQKYPECTWEHSWEQKKQIRLIALSTVFQKHLVVFWRWQKKIYNCCFLSGSIRLWLSQLFRSQALVETSNVIMMIFFVLKEGLPYGFIIFRLHLPTMVKHLRGKVEHLHTNGDVSKGQTCCAEFFAPHFSCQSVCGTRMGFS